MEEKILIGQEIKHKIETSNSKIKVKIDMEMTVPLMEGIFFGQELWTLKTQAEATRTDPVNVIRGVRKINGNQISE